ncbi:MAG: hypothetical protein ACREF8_00045, partial [Chthoniobacterales bacterium]
LIVVARSCRDEQFAPELHVIGPSNYYRRVFPGRDVADVFWCQVRNDFRYRTEHAKRHDSGRPVRTDELPGEHDRFVHEDPAGV